MKTLTVRRSILAFACASTLAIGACQSGAQSEFDEAQTAPPPAEGVAETPGGAEELEATTPARTLVDRGPLLHRYEGAIEVGFADARTVSADAHAVDDGHVYIRAQLGEPLGEESQNTWQPQPELVHATVDVGGAHAVAVADGNGTVHVRIVGKDVPEKVEVWLAVARPAGYGDGPAAAAWEYQLTIEDVASSKRSTGLRVETLMAMSAWFDQTSRIAAESDLFRVFAATRVARMAHESGDHPTDRDALVPDGRRRGSELAQTMELYSGITAVEESLQTERALGIRSTDLAAEATVDIADVTPLSIGAHPWEEMIDALGTEPVIEGLAHKVPHDVVYLYVDDLRTFAAMSRELDTWVTPITQALEERPGHSHFTERIERQLAVRRTGIAETLGHVAADGVAVVAGDPFLREGTDVALVFDVASQTVLDTALAGFETQLREQGIDLTVDTREIDGHSVRVMTSPDGRVRQHRLQLDDDTLVVANSMGSVQRFVDVAEGRRPALASAGDFRYLRARYPYPNDPEVEDGFLFVGDALVERVASPEARIAHARRMHARADLLAVNYTALLQGWLEGEPPATIDAMVRSGWLDAAAATHADGSPIAFGLDTGARSEVWGAAHSLRPLSELAVPTRITPAEKVAYEQFRDSYQEQWRRFVDPIGVRIDHHAGGGFSVDGRMLPLVEATRYDELIDAVGDTTFTLPELSSGQARFVTAIDPDSRYRAEVEGLLMWVGRDLKLDWLGHWMVAGTVDHSGIWDAALQVGAISEARSRSSSDDEMLAVMSRLPVWIGFHVVDQAALATFRRNLRNVFRETGFGYREAGVYRDQAVSVISEPPGMLAERDGDQPIEVWVAVADDVFLIALQRQVLEAQIDAVLAGEMPTAQPNAGATWTAAQDADTPFAQTVLEWSPGDADGWLVRTGLGVIDDQLMAGNEAALIAEQNLVSGLGAARASGVAGRDQALALIGFEPADVDGGGLATDDHDLVQAAHRGSLHLPIYPPVPIENTPLTETLGDIERVRMALGFEGQDEHRGLRVRIDYGLVRK